MIIFLDQNYFFKDVRKLLFDFQSNYFLNFTVTKILFERHNTASIIKTLGSLAVEH